MSTHIITVINGDTDSVKVLSDMDSLQAISNDLATLGHSIDKAKEKVCERVKASYPQYYDELEQIGYYVHEFASDKFCASWNKAYCTYNIDKRDGKRHFNFTLAGVPTSRRTNAVSSFIGVNGYADRLIALGYTFEQVCNLLLGYNVTLANDVIRMNARKFPNWGATFFDTVTDYLGNCSLVVEPAALALYPMGKAVNDTSNDDNRINCEYAKRNNSNVNTNDVIVTGKGVFELGDVFGYD